MTDATAEGVHLTAGAASLVGRVRTGNEDSMLVTSDVFVVADGMGGHLAGEVASAIAVDVLSQAEAHRSLVDLVAAVHLANRQISDRSAESEDLHGMGTTICVVGLVDEEGEHLAILNVGDSRIYLLADAELRQLTDDHSLVESLVREGRITAAEAEIHPQRNVLTRALGVEPLVLVDAWLLKPRDGDRLLLCSDGLFNELAVERIREILADGDAPEVTARRLAAEAEAAGGRDNITTVVVDVSNAAAVESSVDERFRRIATPTVDLDDHFRDASSDTATVPLVPISPVPERDSEVSDEADDPSVNLDEQADGPDPVDVGGGSYDDSGEADGSSTSGDAEVPDENEDPGSAPTETMDGEADEGRRTWRTPAFVVALLLIVAVVIGVVLVGARDGWYVGVDDNVVVIYRGQFRSIPLIGGGEVKRFDDIEVDSLTPKSKSDVTKGRRFDTESGAVEWVDGLSIAGPRR